MLEKPLEDDEIINNEVERLKLLFIKEKYDDEQKRWFLTAKVHNATKSKDLIALKVCDILLSEIKKEVN